MKPLLISGFTNSINVDKRKLVISNKIQKEKKFVNKDVFICIHCGSDQISHSDYTLHCSECDSLNFYEVAIVW